LLRKTVDSRYSTGTKEKRLWFDALNDLNSFRWLGPLGPGALDVWRAEREAIAIWTLTEEILLVTSLSVPARADDTTEPATDPLGKVIP
jgi:hypothetical protein